MNHHNPTTRKHFPVIHSVALVLISFMLVFSAYTKLSGHPDAMNLFHQLHLLPFMKAFGIIQLIIAVCLWWRPLRILGTLLGSAYFGAGVVMMLSIGESALMSTILLLLTWIIHKCSWWSMWKHGYRCGCKACQSGHDILPRSKAVCDCGKNGCMCERGSCTC